MITKYINYLREVRNLSENTLKGYENDLRGFARWAKPQQLTWRTVTKQDIDRYTASRHEDASAASIRRAISSIRCFLRWMKSEGYLNSNAAQYCQSPKLANNLPNCASMSAMDNYLTTPADSNESRIVHAMVALMTETGIRIQEAIDLKMQDFNPEIRSIKIHGKGKKERIVYYTDNLLPYLIPVANMRNGYVLPTDNQYQLRFQFYREMRKHGIKTNPHAIRHAWATHMLTNGADIMTVSFLMGHESVKTTERYAKVSNEMARHIYESINN